MGSRAQKEHYTADREPGERPGGQGPVPPRLLDPWRRGQRRGALLSMVPTGTPGLSQVSCPRAGRRVKLLQPDGRALKCIVVAEARAQRTAARLGLGFELLRQRLRQPRAAP